MDPALELKSILAKASIPSLESPWQAPMTSLLRVAIIEKRSHLLIKYRSGGSLEMDLMVLL